MQAWIIAYARVVPYCEPAEALLWCFSIHMYWLSQMTPTTWLKRALLQLFLSFSFLFSLFFSFLSFPLSFVFCVCEVRRVWFFACMGLARFFFHFLLSPFNWAVEKLWLWLECLFAPKTALLLTTRSCLQETPTCGDFGFFLCFFLSLFLPFFLSFVQHRNGAVMMSTSQAVSEPKWRKLVQNWKGPPAAAPSLLIPLF